MSAFLMFLLALFAIGSAGSTVYFRRRVQTLRVKLKAAKKNTAEIGNFMNIFSRNIRNVKETVNWMNVTARYVADTIDAASVCIFTRDGDRLTMTGAAGRIPQNLRRLQIRSDREKPFNESFHEDETTVEPPNLLESVIQFREAVFIDDPQDRRLREIDLDPYYRITTFMAVPMVADGNSVGILCAVNRAKNESMPFDTDQFRRFKFLSSHVVLAENIMAVYSNLSEQQRISQELQFAQGLQKSLLPKSMPDWGLFQIDAISRSSKEVSGDFFDYVEIDKDRLLVVIGDACGKGIPACMIMAMTRSFIRSNAGRFSSLKDMLLELNENLFHDMGDGRYITLGACLINRRESTMEYVRAGHTELLIYVRGHIRSINPEGAGLGLLPSDLIEFDAFCIELTPEMEIMIFTDGINEATNPNGEYFGIERIKQVFVKSCVEHDPPRDSLARVMGAVDEFSQNPTSQADDQTVVIIRHI